MLKKIACRASILRLGFFRTMHFSKKKSNHENLEHTKLISPISPIQISENSFETLSKQFEFDSSAETGQFIRKIITTFASESTKPTLGLNPLNSNQLIYFQNNFVKIFLKFVSEFLNNSSFEKIEMLIDFSLNQNSDFCLSLILKSSFNILHHESLLSFLLIVIPKMTDSSSKKKFKFTNEIIHKTISPIIKLSIEPKRIIYQNSHNMLIKSAFFLNFHFPEDPLLNPVFQFLFNSQQWQDFDFRSLLTVFYLYCDNQMLNNSIFYLNEINTQIYLELMNTWIKYNKNIRPEIQIQETTQITNSDFLIFVQLIFIQKLSKLTFIEECIDFLYSLSKHNILPETNSMVSEKLLMSDNYLRFSSKSLILLIRICSKNPSIDPDFKIRVAIFSLYNKHGFIVNDFKADSIYTCLLSLRQDIGLINPFVYSHKSNPEQAFAKLKNLTKIETCKFYINLWDFYAKNYKNFDAHTNLRIIYEYSHSFKTISFVEFSEHDFREYLWLVFENKSLDLNFHDHICIAYIMKRFMNLGRGSVNRWKKLLEILIVQFKEYPNDLGEKKMKILINNLLELLNKENSRFPLAKKGLLEFVQIKENEINVLRK